MMQNYRDDNEFYNAYLDLIRIPRIREIKKKKKKKKEKSIDREIGSISKSLGS